MSTRITRGMKNVLFGLLQQFITLAIGLILPRLFILNYGSETNGLISSIKQIYTYVALFEAGVGTATLQALFRTIACDDNKSTNAVMAATNRYYKRTGCFYLMAVVGLSIIYPLVVETNIDTLTIISIILLEGLGGCISFFFQGKFLVLLRAEGKSYVLSSLSIVFFILTNIAKIFLVQMRFHIAFIQMTYFVLNIAQMIVVEIYIRKNYKWIDLRVTPDYDSINQKNAVMVHRISDMLLNGSDVLLLTLFCDLKIVSVYTVFISFFYTIKSFLFCFLDGVNFNLGQTYHQDKRKHEKMFDAIEVYYRTLTFVVYTVLYIFILPFMKLYTKGVTDINYIDSYLPIFFTIIVLLQAGKGPFELVISHAEHFKNTQWRAVAEAVIKIVVSVICIQFFGIYGVLIGTIIAMLYRTNDVIFYANRNIFKRSVYLTYRRYLVNVMLFIIITSINTVIVWDFKNYFSIIIWAVIVFIMALAVFFVINSVFERESFLMLKNIIIMQWTSKRQLNK